MRVLDLRGDPERDLSEVVAHIRAGGLVAYPTETVYGLGGAGTIEVADRIRALKGRDGDKPILALVPNADSVAELAWSDGARVLASIFWPGSVTLVLEDPLERFPPGVRDPVRGTVGVRVTPHPTAARLVSDLGAPLLSTSLNRAGEPAAASGSEARAVLEAMSARDVWLLDSGALPPSKPSTVVDCTGPEPRVLRSGAVPIGRLRCALPEIHGSAD